MVYIKKYDSDEARKEYRSQLMKGNNHGFKKGHSPWHKGKKLSIDHTLKLRLAKLGKKQSKESIEKRRISLKEHYKTNNSWQKGLTGIKTSNKGQIAWNKGLTKEDERVKKYVDKFNERRKDMILPKKDTSIEVKIQNFLAQLGIEYFTHKYIKEIEHGYQCDVFIPSMNLVIECDGNYWHKYPTGRDIDKIRTSELIEQGFKVLRLWEHEIKTMDLDKFKELLL